MYLYPEKRGNRYRPFLLRRSPIHVNLIYESQSAAETLGHQVGPRLSSAICCLVTLGRFPDFSGMLPFIHKGENHRPTLMCVKAECSNVFRTLGHVINAL